MTGLINKLYNLFYERSITGIDYRKPYRKDKIDEIINAIINLSIEIKNIYPHYSSELFKLKGTLSISRYNDYYNCYEYKFENNTFVALFSILKALKYDIDNGNNLGFWSYIHPTIIKVSQQLYIDNHYNKAVLSAFIEIEVRLKAIRKKLKPLEKELIGAQLMAAVFTNNDPTLLEFQSREDDNGHNVQKGFMQIFAGAMTGIRNLPAHGNSDIPKDDAIRRLMLASLLMYKVDEAVKFTGIAE